MPPDPVSAYSGGAQPITREPKIAAIQLLRALAALSVAAAHFAGGFGRYIDDRLGDLSWADHAAQSAVALFFVISGCVMVVSSARLFGKAGGSLEFWRRRAIRVVPPYWIATLILVLVSLSLGLPANSDDVARSLLFVPYRNAEAEGLFLPYLWPGWSLFYEMLFYALFGIFVFAGRTWTIALTSLALVVLVAVGQVAQFQSVPALAATRPVLLLFILGMAMGIAFERGLALPGWARLSCLALAIVAMIFVPDPPVAAPLGYAYLLWAGAPALFLFVAVAGGPLPLPPGRWVELGGDASYAIYLLHVPLAHVWIRLFVRLHYPGGSLGYVVSALGLLIVASLAFHRFVERPMTKRINAIFDQR